MDEISSVQRITRTKKGNNVVTETLALNKIKSPVKKKNYKVFIGLLLRIFKIILSLLVPLISSMFSINLGYSRKLLKKHNALHLGQLDLHDFSTPKSLGASIKHSSNILSPVVII